MFDLVFKSANACGLVPVYLCCSYGSIVELNFSEALTLSPPAFTIYPAKPGYFLNSVASSKSSLMIDFSNNLEMRCFS